MIEKIKADKLFVLSIIGILFIPILYSAFFIGAFKDPYNNLDKVDVAIVNNDKEVILNDETLNLGEELVEKLKDNEKFKWNFVDSEEAIKGMEDNKYYFTVEIPEDFSKNVSATLNNDKKESNLIYRKNDNNNYIIGLLGTTLLSELKAELNQNITSTFLETLAFNLDETNKLKEGTEKLLDGSNELKNGIVDLKSGANKLNESTKLLSDNAYKLSNGTNELNTSYSSFNNGLTDINTNMEKVTGGYNSLSSSMSEYKLLLEASVNSSDLNEETKALLLESYNSILETTNYLNNNLVKLNGGVTSLKTNSNVIKNSLNTINSSTSTISSYLNELNTGTINLYNGTNEILNGSISLTEGVSELNDGIIQMNNSIEDLNLKDNAKNIVNTVGSIEENYSEVENYGYGFSPYFISLGLFVGGITSIIVIGAKNNSKKKTKKEIINRVKLYLFVAIMQALVLNTILLLTQIHIDNVLIFNLFTILMSLAFMAIIQVFTLLFNDIGKFICIILLIFQLTSSGGTFPVETSPEFFRILHDFMPMTYTVNALRAIIGNGNMDLVLNASLILGGIIICSSVIIIIYFKTKTRKELIN